MEEEKTAKFAERLKEKLAGSKEAVHTDESATELVDSQLDAVSGGASHASTTHDSTTDTPQQQ